MYKFGERYEGQDCRSNMKTEYTGLSRDNSLNFCAFDFYKMSTCVGVNIQIFAQVWNQLT